LNQLYMGGDVRVNENPALCSIHTLFVREHNRRALLLPSTWTDEQRFQQARRFVIAHFQSITFNEWLPTLTGAPSPKYVYNSNLNPQVSLFFSTVAFRFGHDVVPGILTRYNRTGLPYKDGHMLLRDGFFFPEAVGKVGIDAYLRGITTEQIDAFDAQLEDDIRVFLYNFSPILATDLGARNLQRARDNGIGNYNSARLAYNLSTCDTWACINSDQRIQNLLTQAYGPNNVSVLDPYVGGLLEAKLPNSNLGALFTAAIVEQLTRTRNADRFFYQNTGIFTSSELAEIEATKLSDIIKRNCDIPTLPTEVFTRKDISPSAALGGVPDDTKYIIAIVIPCVIAALLIIIIIGMCFAHQKKNRMPNDEYQNFIEEK